jgi:hypothetical protein
VPGQTAAQDVACYRPSVDAHQAYRRGCRRTDLLVKDGDDEQEEDAGDAEQRVPL